MILGGVIILLGLAVQPLGRAVGWLNRVARRLSHFPACDTITEFTDRILCQHRTLALTIKPTDLIEPALARRPWNAIRCLFRRTTIRRAIVASAGDRADRTTKWIRGLGVAWRWEAL